MANTNPQSYTIPVDSQGNWELRLPNVFTPGTKGVVVTPDQQPFQEVVLITVDGAWPTRTRIIESIPTIFLGSLWLLLLVLFGFAAYHFYVVRRHGHKKASTAQHKAVRTLITFTSFLAVAIVVGTFVILQQSGFMRGWRWWGSNVGVLSSTQYVQVSGAVVDPVSGLGVAGVDLVSGDTAIHTSDGGRFTFAQVVPAIGIRLTYPGLLRTIVKLVDNEPVMNIPFSVAMYNQLITVVDAEGRGRLQAIYDQLPESIKDQQSFDDFTRDYRSIYNQASVMQQEITIAEVKNVRNRRIGQYDLKFDAVYEVTLQNGEARAQYQLGLIADQWYVVK